MCSAGAAIAIGGLVQGFGASSRAQATSKAQGAQAAISLNQAKLREIQAEEAKEQGEVEATQTRLSAASALADQAADTAGSGIDVGGGTAQELFQDTKRAGAEDELTVRRNARKRVWALKQEARNLKSTAAQQKSAAASTSKFAPLALVSPIISGFGRAELAGVK